MKVITIESSAFTALTEQIAEIAVYVRAVSGERKGESSDMLLTTREAAHLLNVSTVPSNVCAANSASAISCCAANAATAGRK